MPAVIPFKLMRPDGEAPRLIFENPILASGTGAMPAGIGICADAWTAYSRRQRKLLERVFIRRRRARGPTTKTSSPSRFSKKPAVGVPVGRMEVSRRKENPVKALIGEPEKA